LGVTYRYTGIADQVVGSILVTGGTSSWAGIAGSSLKVVGGSTLGTDGVVSSGGGTLEASGGTGQASGSIV